MIWSHLKPGGAMFIYETPYRYFPIEMHTTGLPRINYLPTSPAHAVVKVAGRPGWKGRDWPYLLRAGIRGATAKEVLKVLGPNAKLIPPTRLGGKDRVDLWYAKASEGRRSQRSKDIVYKAMRVFKSATGVDMLPELSIAVRKAA